MKNRIDTIHFGGINFSEQEIIDFPKGIPGFERLKRFLLIQGEDYQPFKFLQSVEDPAISFPLLSPQLIRSDYHFALSDQQRSELELEQPEEALIYCIVTIAQDPTQTTANLFSPVVINSEKRKAAQLLLLESGYLVDEPVLKTD